MKTNREERIARVYIGGNEYVNFTKETYLLFKKIVLCGIEQAKKNNEDLNKLMVMSSMGDVFLLNYAKYMVQYLDDFYKN